MSSMFRNRIDQIAKQLQLLHSKIEEHKKAIQDIVTKCVNIVKRYERLLSSLLYFLIKAVDRQVKISLELMPVIKSHVLDYVVIDKYIIFNLQFETVDISREKISLNLSERIEEVFIPLDSGGVTPVPSKKLFSCSTEYPTFKNVIYIIDKDKIYVIGIPDMRYFSLNASLSDSLFTASRFVRVVGMINLVYNLDTLMTLASQFIPTKLDTVKKKIDFNAIISDSTLLKI